MGTDPHNQRAAGNAVALDGALRRLNEKQAIKELIDALRFASMTIEHRDGLKYRLDLFTEDERCRLRTAIRTAEALTQ